MIKIVIAEDQMLVLGAMARLLEIEEDIEVVALAKNGKEAMEAVRQHTPDVLISDIEMPEMDGIALAKRVHADLPDTRVLLVTTFNHAGYFGRAMEAEVAGYLLKSSPIDELLKAVRSIAAGETIVDPMMERDDAAVPRPHLSTREEDVLRLAELGMSNKEIARELGISPGTARNYLADAAVKLNAKNRVEATRKARSLGLI